MTKWQYDQLVEILTHNPNPNDLTSLTTIDMVIQKIAVVFHAG